MLISPVIAVDEYAKSGRVKQSSAEGICYLLVAECESEVVLVIAVAVIAYNNEAVLIGDVLSVEGLYMKKQL